MAPGFEHTDPEVLGQIDAPVLVLLAQQTRLDTWFTDSAQHVTQHVADRVSANYLTSGTLPRWSHPSPSPRS